MEAPHVSLGAQALFHIGPINVTNSMMLMFVVMALLLLVGTMLSRRVVAAAANGTNPGRGGSIAEMIVEYFINLCENTAGKRVGRRILPLILGIFIFIICSNFTGLLPGVGTIMIKHDAEHAATEEHATTAEHTSDATQVAGAAVNANAGEKTTAGEAEKTTASEDKEESHDVPVFRPPTADLNMTLAMSTLTFVVVQIAGVAAHGVGGRLKHMANPPFLFPIEVVSELSRIISLAARLFGNVFAGEVLMGVMYAIANAVKIAIIPIFAPVVFLGLETLFGTIQALVFALLTLIYVYLAAAGHDDHGEHADENHDMVRAVDDDKHQQTVAAAAVPQSGD